MSSCHRNGLDDGRQNRVFYQRQRKSIHHVLIILFVAILSSKSAVVASIGGRQLDEEASSPMIIDLTMVNSKTAPEGSLLSLSRFENEGETVRTFTNIPLLLKLTGITSKMTASQEDLLSSTMTQLLENIQLTPSEDVLEGSFFDIRIEVGRQMEERKREHSSKHHEVMASMVALLRLSGKYHSLDDVEQEHKIIEGILKRREDEMWDVLVNLKTKDDYFGDITEVQLLDSSMLDVYDAEMAGDESGGGGVSILAIVSVVTGLLFLGLAVLLYLDYDTVVLNYMKNKTSAKKQLKSDDDATVDTLSLQKDDEKAYDAEEQEVTSTFNTIYSLHKGPSPFTKMSDNVKQSWEKAFKSHKRNTSYDQIIDDADPIIQLETSADDFLAEDHDDSSSLDSSSLNDDDDEMLRTPTTTVSPEIRGECFAPPGKLGVAIDTINGVPVVHKVKMGSPLEGILSHLDRIVEIDGVDTSQMSGADVTKLMISKMKKVRKIAYVRGGGFKRSGDEEVDDDTI